MELIYLINIILFNEEIYKISRYILKKINNQNSLNIRKTYKLF